MSVEAIATVLHHSAATGTDKLVLVGIANHMGDGGSYPSLATLAKYANVSVRSVQRSIDRLEELGEISVKLHGGGGRDTRADRRPNRYTLLLACPQGCRGGPQHASDDPMEHAPDPRTSQGKTDGTTPTSPRTGDDLTPTTPRDDERGDADDATGRRPRHDGVTPTSGEPSLNRPRTTPPTPQRQPEDLRTALLDACGVSDATPTRSEARSWDTAARELAQIGALPDEIRHRTSEFRRRWPHRQVTPTAIARNWTTLGQRPPRARAHLGPLEQARADGAALGRSDVAPDEALDDLPDGPELSQAFIAGFWEARDAALARSST